MTGAATRQYFWIEQGALHYTLIGLVSLAVLFLNLQERGLEYWGLFPILIGLAGVGFRWRAAPVFFLIALGLCLSTDQNLWLFDSGGVSMRLADIIFAAAVLGYVQGQYRLVMIGAAFPKPPKMRKKKTKVVPPPASPVSVPTPPASRRLVSPQEIGLLVMTLPAWAIAAHVIWSFTPTAWGNPGVHSNVWRVILMAWLLAAPLLVSAAALAYLTRLRMPASLAALFLQDQLWSETRWEQRRIQRWFAWAHVKEWKRQAVRHRWGWVKWALVLTALMVVVALILRAWTSEPEAAVFHVGFR